MQQHFRLLMFDRWSVSAKRQTIPSAMPIALLLCVWLWTSGCAPERQRSVERQGDIAAQMPLAVSESYPLAYLTQRIAGETLEVVFPIPADVYPPAWRPSSDEVRRMQEADVILLNAGGIQYAQWLTHISLPESRMCRMIDGLEIASLILVSDYIVHAHGPHGEHSHSGLVSNVWLDPRLAIDLAQHITHCLSQRFPDYENVFRQNLAFLEDDLQKLDHDFTALAHRVPTPTTVLTSTPQLKYLTRRAGVHDVHFHWSNRPGQPDQRQWEVLDERLKQIETPVAMMLWPGIPDEQVLSQLNDRGIAVLEVDMADHPRNGRDYLATMRFNLQQLQLALIGEE